MDEAIDHYKVVLLREGEKESDDRSASVPSSPCTYRQPARPFSMVPSSAGRVVGKDEHIASVRRKYVRCQLSIDLTYGHLISRGTSSSRAKLGIHLSSDRDTPAPSRTKAPPPRLSIYWTRPETGTFPFPRSHNIYYRDARGAALVNDVMDRPSFSKRVRGWTGEIRKNGRPTSTKYASASWGIKIDMHDRAVDAKEAYTRTRRSVGAAFSEVFLPIREGGVEDLFVELTKEK